MPIMKCDCCGKRFAGRKSTSQHIQSKHQGQGTMSIYEPPEREESFAERAIAAELAIAMGEPTDDDWLLP